MFRMNTTLLLVLGATLCLGQLVIAATPSVVSQRVTQLTKALNLTAEQQAQAQQIFTDAHQQVLQVLTPVQQQARQTHQMAFHAALKALKLTATQKTQLKTLRQQAHAHAQAIQGNTALATADKATQLRILRKTTHAQMLQLLTSDQQTLVQNTMAQAKQQHQLRTLGLSKAQRQQIHKIRSQAQAAFRATLTPQQQQQFDQYRAKRKQGQTAETAA